MMITQAGGILQASSFNIGKYTSGTSEIFAGLAWENLFSGRVDGANCPDKSHSNIIDWVNDVEITNVTLADCQGGFGINCQFIDRMRVKNLRAERIGQAPLRGQGINDLIWAYLDYLDCGRAAHSRAFRL